MIRIGDCARDRAIIKKSQDMNVNEIVTAGYHLAGICGEYPVIHGSEYECREIVQIKFPDGQTDRRKKRDRCEVTCAGVGEQMVDIELFGVQKCNAWIDEQASRTEGIGAIERIGSGINCPPSDE